MKIMITFLGYGENVFAGMERSIFMLADGLIKIGNEVIIYTGTMHNKIDNGRYKVIYDNNLIKKLDPKIGCVDDQIKDNYYMNNSAILENFIRVYHQEKPDYILVQDHLWGIVPHINIFKNIKCKIGLLFHMSTHNIDLIKKMFDFPFDDFFCVSEFVKSEIFKLCKPKQELIVLPNCISNEFFVSKLEDKKEINNFLCNSRISKEKGVSELLDIWMKFIDLYPTKKLYLTDGEFQFLVKDEIADKINKINSKHADTIVILGNLNWDLIPNFIKKMDCLLVPSKMESFGLAALEGMASGLYVVSTDSGNLKYLFNGVTKTFDCLDQQGFLNEMVDIVEHKSLYNKKYAIKKAKQYYNIDVAKRLIEVIKK